MKETANFGLKKPEENEFYDVNVQNDNMDNIDRVLQEYKDGTQRVGDSAKLGGKDASEYALDTDLLNYLLFNGSKQAYNPVSDLNNFYTGIGLFNGAANEPYPAWWLVVSAGVSGTVSQVAFNLSRELTPKTRYCAGNTWVDWTDLNKDYLPLSGGTLSGALSVKNGWGGIDADSFVVNIYSRVNPTNELLYRCLRLWNSNNKPMSSAVSIYDSSTDKEYTMLHTGNKPSGTYTGNGDATKRTIQTSGIGGTVKITSSTGYTVIITTGTSFGGNAVNYVGFDWGECHVISGGFEIASTHAALNQSGVAYNYEYL